MATSMRAANPPNTLTRVLSAIKTSVSSRVADMMDHPHIPAASNLRMDSFGFLLLPRAQVTGNGFDLRML
jgi:hypothetical protein